MKSSEREKINKSLGKICKVERCDRGTYAKGYCNKHYNQMKRNGKILKKENELIFSSTGVCKVVGCNEKSVAKCYCLKHYQRWKKHGDPTKGAFKSKGICSVDWCNESHAANSYCKKHWTQMYRIGRILEPHEEKHPRWSKHPTGICSIDGCNNKHYVHDLCKKHHAQKCKQRAVEYKGGRCQICGYAKYFGALEFHHKDPKVKDFVVGSWTHSSNQWEKIKREIDKCILVCSNCHREIHYKQFELEKAA